MFVYTLSLMIGTAGLLHVIMRFFTVPTVAAARSSAGWAIYLYRIIVFTRQRLLLLQWLNLT